MMGIRIILSQAARMFHRIAPYTLFLFVLAMSAAAQTPYRIGLQTGVTSERSSFEWIGSPGRTLETEDRQNGHFGMIVDFPLTDTWRMEFSPHYGQRNYQFAPQEQSGAQYSIIQNEVDYLALPVILRWLPFPGGILRPFAAAGVEFGPNLNHTSVVLAQYRYSDEPPFTRKIERTVSVNQLYGATLIEIGLDIQASAAWSVLLGARYTREWTPLIDDPALTWEAPHSWKVRFALLYTIDF